MDRTLSCLRPSPDTRQNLVAMGRKAGILRKSHSQGTHTLHKGDAQPGQSRTTFFPIVSPVLSNKQQQSTNSKQELGKTPLWELIMCRNY